jgi:hypothetical protein
MRSCPGHAVGQMAQKTSLLLHIVYGAEIKRILAQASRAAGAVEQLKQEAQQLTPDSDHAAFLESVKTEAAKLKSLADKLGTVCSARAFYRAALYACVRVFTRPCSMSVFCVCCVADRRRRCRPQSRRRTRRQSARCRSLPLR